jgi:hypothetical protein
MARSCRKPVVLSESLHQRLSSYALAASAAGVGVLALAQPAEARIVYTPTHKVLHGSKSYPKPVLLDLNHDSRADFKLFDAWFVDQDFGPTGWLTIVPAASPNGVEGQTVNFGTLYDSALVAEARIGQTAHFYSNNSHAAMCDAHQSSHSAFWCGVRDRYLGLKFAIQGKIHYGWARFSTSVDQRAHITATLTGYAYETVPNKAIVAGKTKGPDVITVQPGTLGQLAHGAAAIPTWRTKP